jgi:hypothetical protein
MGPIFCFIDDSRFELDVFTDHIIPAAEGIEFILGSTYARVREQLGERHPCLFLLDLYGQDDQVVSTGIPAREDLEAETASFMTLDDVYKDLDQVTGDKQNEYLKRLFHLADSWRRLFYRASRQAGQNINYGLSNLESAWQDFPAAATVAYTRKSMIMDAVDIMGAGIDGLHLKPDGHSDEDIRRVTTEAAPALIEAWSDLVTQKFINYFQGLIFLLFRSGLEKDVAHYAEPNRMSDQARALLGPGNLTFLEEAATWWSHIGQEPVI